MNIAMAFHSGDKEQVVRWLGWLEELDGIGRHKLWLLPAKGQTADFHTSVPFTVLEDSYGTQSDWSAHNGAVRDASGANSMIRQFCWHFFLGKLGFWFFCEPDAIPLRATAFDELEDEYRAARKYFLGALVPGKEDQYPDHMTGNGIYPEDALARSKLLMLPTYAEFEGRRVELAFDIVAAPEILAHYHNTRLIQHVFRGPKFEKMDDLARINPEAVIWHSDKDGGLIRLLRQKMKGGDELCIASSTDGAIPTKDAPVAQEATRPSNAAATSDPKPPRAHTYFRPCSDPKALAEQKRILAIWEKNWRDAGWEPVVLTEADARRHPQFEKYRKAFEALPTVSPKEYEMACWLRWVAMSQIGGLLTDYDTLCNGFDIPNPSPDFDYPVILSNNNPVPCAVLGTKEQYQRAVDAFLTCPAGAEKGHLHLSDMLAVQALKFPALDICREYGTKDWEKAKLIHFSHRAGGQARSKWMQWFVDKNPRLITEHFIAAPLPRCERTPADCIIELVEFSKKDGFAKGRIVKQLRKAGLIPAKK